MYISCRLSLTPSQTLQLYPLNFKFLLLLMIFEWSHHQNYALELTGACKQRCEETRPLGVKHPFIFKCHKAYHTEAEKEKCEESCVSCPQEVCDEAIDPSYWHCPSAKLEDDVCIDLCNHHREGRREKFILDCDEVYSKDEDRKACTAKCSRCPSFVCHPEEPHIFHCPDEEVEHICRSQCDMVREYGQLGPFTFNCEKKWGNNHFAKTTCQNVCRKYCPFWVCDGVVNHNEYQCPSIQLDRECQKFCDANRPPTALAEPYQLNCKKLYRNFPPWEWACEEKCNLCDTFPRINPICDDNNLQYFHCPQAEPEYPPEPHIKISSLEGCIARCENNRGGGHAAPYTLNCLTAYETTEEKLDCLADCRGCPRGICSGLEINCPPDHHKIREEEGHAKGRAGNDTMEEEEIEAEKQLEEEKNTTIGIIIGFVVVYVIVIVIFLGILCWRAKKARDKAPVPLQQQHFIQSPPKYPRYSADMDQQGFGEQQAPPHQPTEPPTEIQQEQPKPYVHVPTPYPTPRPTLT